jgi:hypothetical protein
MILAALDGMQGRLTLEKLELYSAHFKQDICVIRCQTVSHLSTAPTKPSMGGVFAWCSESRGKNRLKRCLGGVKSAQKGRSNNKIALEIWRLPFLTAWLAGKPAHDGNLIRVPGRIFETKL